MSSGPSEARRRWFRTVGFHLNAWYVFVLVTGLAATYLTVAFLTGYAVEQADRQIIVAKLEEYWARFEGPDFRDLTSEIPASALRVEDEPFLVRVSDARNRALFTHVPEANLVFEERSLEVITAPDRHTWTRVRSVGDGRAWTIGTTALSGGRRLQIGMSSHHSDTIVSHLRRTVLLGFLPLLALGLLGGIYLTRRALRPVRNLSDTMRAIERSGDLGARVTEPGTGDELDELSGLFNRLMTAQERLVTAMRESLDNVAHDLRTPLARLRGSAEAALACPPEQADLQEALADCLEEAERAGAMLKTLMDISEAQAGVMKLAREEVDLAELAEDVLELYEYVAEDHGLEVTRDLAPGVVVSADKMRLFRAAANLVDNALKYTPSGRAVHVAVRAAGEVAELEVADEGPGIAPEDVDRIWDRLYRADKSRSEAGLGLGLSFVKAIVEAHGGAVSVTTKPGGGARFLIRVPTAHAGPSAPG